MKPRWDEAGMNWRITVANQSVNEVAAFAKKNCAKPYRRVGPRFYCEDLNDAALLAIRAPALIEERPK